MDVLIGLFFLFGLPAIAIYFARKWYKLKKEFDVLNNAFVAKENEIQGLNSNLSDKNTEIANLTAKLETLSKYEAITDAEAEAARIIQEANTKATSNLQTSQQQLATAMENAERIINDARIEAEKIAGTALEAKDRADEYVKAEKAMRNIIKGYGHAYLIPNLSVLDDLAEEFSHADAGQKLKDARAFTRSLIKERKAATCDYVETEKHDTAVKFVTDAFNGKVDSALSKVKYDNYGTIKQQIEDAFSVVNDTGRAFRNAKITQLYFNARLEELRWAVATNELKKIEQDEQRRIKELMREEERARREIQKALDDAAKEEKLLKKAMEEARKHIESATQEERAKYEAQLSELQAKLAIAEEKNQRALSMAQQTRSGHVYVISNIGSFGENVYKIGMTRRLEPTDRVTELGDASVPFSFDIHAMIYSVDAPTLEKTLHRKFVNNQVNKVNPRKEFFGVTLAEIREAIEEMGIEAHWTMTAEAREYYESQSMTRPLEFIEEEYETGEIEE